MYSQCVVLSSSMEKRENYPDIKQVQAARTAASLSQSRAAQLMGVTARVWQNWELRGTFPRHTFELFLVKTGQFRVLDWVPPAKLMEPGEVRLKLSTGDIVSLRMRPEAFKAFARDVSRAADNQSGNTKS